MLLTKFELFAEYFVFQTFNDHGLNRSADEKSFIKKKEEKGGVKKKNANDFGGSEIAFGRSVQFQC